MTVAATYSSSTEAGALVAITGHCLTPPVGDPLENDNPEDIIEREPYRMLSSTRRTASEGLSQTAISLFYKSALSLQPSGANEFIFGVHHRPKIMKILWLQEFGQKKRQGIQPPKVALQVGSMDKEEIFIEEIFIAGKGVNLKRSLKNLGSW
ncbi:hypothetical protein AVEN_63224-1 [Araneus ventricosus]|uniref:Uncharacterized protein n=1 Tax=Araneus ventricosus TaxID=182803 RepID=A0A4Y2B356_ARAVE|nr:hypothetical protein AVEN_63224-1 [Araneus ventricosus]